MKRRWCLALGLLFVCGACHAWAQEAANGVFLVAQPTLTDATFRRTVILITQRPDGGSIGVILNRPAEESLRELLPQHEHIVQHTQTAYFGGPVHAQGPIFLVRAAAPPPGSLPILRDVYLTTDADWVNQALGEKRITARVYLGYAAWAPKQLRGEMAREGWYMLPADSATIFESDVRELWFELVKRAVLRRAANAIKKIQ